MKIKNKYLLLSSFFVVFLLSVTNFVFALEVPLTKFGLPENPSLGQYAVFIFQTAISLAGFIAVISFAVGAVQYLFSLDSEENKKDGKDRMKGALLGMVLILASFLIISTINPALTNLGLTPLPSTPPPPIATPTGVFFYTGANCAGDSTSAITNSQDDLGAQFDGKIKSLNIIDDTANNNYYGVILHSTAGLTNGGECSLPITNNGCQTINISVSAVDVFKMSTSNTKSGNGVTFYSEPYGWDTGARAGSLPLSDSTIGSSYKNGADSMCFNYENVNRPPQYQYKCGSNTCGKNESTGGDTNTGEPGGNPAVPSCDCPDGTSNPGCCIYYNNKPKFILAIAGDSTGTGSGNSSDANCSYSACETFQDCPGSIAIKGSYLVALYSDAKINGKNILYCQTFNNHDVPNLYAEPIRASSSSELSNVIIIPTQ